MTSESTVSIYGSSEVIVNGKFSPFFENSKKFNLLKKLLSERYQFLFLAPPKIVKYSGNYVVGAGSTIELQCIAIGNPPPLFTWFKNGHSIIPNSRITFKDNSKCRSKPFEDTLTSKNR